MKFIQKKNKIENGFTLVEVLISIFIFSMAIMAVMVALSGGLTSVENAKKKMTAEYLAQEGVEYIRHIRDSKVIASIKTGPAFSGQDGWDQFVGFLQGQGCMSTVSTPTSGCTVLYLQDANSQFLENTEVDNGFNRRITYQSVSATQTIDKIKVTSTIFWDSNSKSVSFSEILYNWPN